MADDRKITLFHASPSRSSSSLLLLEELGVPYDVHLLSLKNADQRAPAYLAVNPMGKVPAIKHGDTLVTEQVAIYLYLADLFPQANLAPAINDPLRGPYLRWMVFYAASFEPALADKASNVQPQQQMSPYGNFDTMLGTLLTQLRKGPYLLGERVTAADILWGSALRWTTMFKLVPETPEVAAYIKRMADRPAAIRAREKDAKLQAA